MPIEIPKIKPQKRHFIGEPSFLSVIKVIMAMCQNNPLLHNDSYFKKVRELYAFFLEQQHQQSTEFSDVLLTFAC